jgi:hypothetical protein
VHGLMNAEALLGPLPSPWTVLRNMDSRGISRVGFFNPETKEKASIEDDPRLGEMPPEWERLEVIPSLDDPYYIQRCRNKITGEEINSDPRLLPEALEKRGVKLQTFRLV